LQLPPCLKLFNANKKWDLFTIVGRRAGDVDEDEAAAAAAV